MKTHMEIEPHQPGSLVRTESPANGHGYICILKARHIFLWLWLYCSITYPNPLSFLAELVVVLSLVFHVWWSLKMDAVEKVLEEGAKLGVSLQLSITGMPNPGDSALPDDSLSPFTGGS